MNPVHAFAFGFIIAAILVALCAVNICRGMLQDARRCGYEDGVDAGRSITRRELSQPTREVSHPGIWTTLPNGRRVPVRYNGEASDF